jgi:hypothetical protein
MGLHDFQDVAENYDYYLSSISPADDASSVVDFHLDLAGTYGSSGVLDIGSGIVWVAKIVQPDFSICRI